MRIYLVLALLFHLVSCSNKDKPLLAPDNLTSWVIEVDANTDTVFSTPKGAALKIAKGTFREKVTLEIKEAYTMQDILLGGLVTESNGQPLASGGMIYINEIDRNPVDLRKPITVAIPTPYIDSQMQLYTSAADSINWIEPDTLPKNIITNNLEMGKQIFRNKCASCHSIDRDLQAPALRGFTQRGNWKDRREVYKWLKNPPAYMARDNYTRNLQKEWGSIMPSFPQLGDQAVDAIINYIQNEENNPYDDITWTLNDSSTLSEMMNAEKICSDTTYFRDVDTASQIDRIDTELLSDTDLFDMDTTPRFASAESISGYRNGFTDAPTSRAYVFQINTLGWYNIDAGVLGMEGTFLCNLEVEVSPKEMTGINVYVFFPKNMDLSVGTRQEGNIFHFDKVNGKIPLFLGATGVAIAFGGLGEDVYVGSASFMVKKEQRITVSLKKSSEEEFLDLIKQNKIEGINLKIEKQKMKVENRPCEETYPGTDTTSGMIDYEVK